MKFSYLEKYGCMIKITNLNDLMEYHASFMTGQAKCYIENKYEKKHDPQTDNIKLLELCRNSSPVDTISSIMSEKIKYMINCIPIYVNKNGGWMSLTRTTEILNIESVYWPDSIEEPRFLQWGCGKHWYVKIGDLDIEWLGKSKWDSLSEAKNAATEWILHKKEAMRYC
jgi:hypothetical protein